MSDEKTGTTKAISWIGLVLFWGVWIYGLLCIGVLSRYREALSVGWGIISGAEIRELERR